MAWAKRESASNLVVLGDDEGQVAKASGLLAAVTEDRQYPGRNVYELVQKNGESLHLAGSASLGRQIFPKDVGKFVRCLFKGWGSSANGKFKQIDVEIFEGDVTPPMKAWPRWAEVQPLTVPATPKKAEAARSDVAKAEGFEDFPEPPDEEDDDLPF